MYVKEAAEEEEEGLSRRSERAIEAVREVREGRGRTSERPADGQRTRTIGRASERLLAPTSGRKEKRESWIAGLLSQLFVLLPRREREGGRERELAARERESGSGWARKSQPAGRTPCLGSASPTSPPVRPPVRVRPRMCERERLE